MKAFCDQRKQPGWSQKQLAEKGGVSRLWISQLENGKESTKAIDQSSHIVHIFTSVKPLSSFQNSR